MRKLKQPDGSTRHERFVRFRVTFLLNDPRYVMLSDGAQGLYIYLEACAISERREILPLEISDPDSLSFARHRPLPVTEKSLAELKSGKRPLVEQTEDGRLRIVGVRKAHGLRFGWHEEAELDEMYDIRKPHGTHTSDIRRTQGRDVDVDVERDVDQDQEKDVDVRATYGTRKASQSPPTATPTATAGNGSSKSLPAYALKALKLIQHEVQSWDCNGFDDMYRLLDLAGRRVKSGYASAMFTAAHAHDCKSPAQFVRQLAAADGDPSNASIAWAKKILSSTAGPVPDAEVKARERGKT